MTDNDTYKMLEAPGEGLYKEKGSKFLAFAFTVYSEEEVKQALAEYRKKYYDARHHCYAFIIGPDRACYRSSDDGEPILNQLLSKEVTNTCVVVVRYFGGVKLGVPGLINAYKTAARDALDNARIVEKTVNDVYSLEFGYPLMNEVMRVMKEAGIEQQNPRFEMDCYLEFSTRKNDAEKIVSKFNNIFGVKVSYLKTV